MKETGGHSVKLEGGSEIIESIEKSYTGIPVGHLGLLHNLFINLELTVRLRRKKRKINQDKIVRKNRLFLLYLKNHKT